MLLQHVGGQREAKVLVRIHEDALAAGVVHHVLVGDPVRRGDHDLIPRIHQRLRQVEDYVLAAHGDDALVGLVIRPEVPGVGFANRLLQLQRA